MVNRLGRNIFGFSFLGVGIALIIGGTSYFLSNPLLGGFLALDRGGTVAFIGTFIFLIGFATLMYNCKPGYMESAQKPEKELSSSR